MPNQRTLPGIGLDGGWAPGDDGWGNPVNRNFLWASVLLRGEAQSRTAALPGSPTPGVVHIVPSNAAENANRIAVYDGPVGQEVWHFLDPVRGMTLRVHASDEYVRWSGSAWVVAAADSRAIPDIAGNGNALVRVNSGGTALTLVQFAALFPSLTGNAGFRLEVNTAGDNVSWVRPGRYPILDPASANVTLTQVMRETLIEFAGVTAQTLTIPQQATQDISVGSLFTVTQIGVGAVNIEAAPGVTINGVPGLEATLSGEYQGVTIYKRAADVWVLQGAFEVVE